MISTEIFRYYPLVSILVFYVLYRNTNNAVTAITFTLILFSVLSLLSSSKNIEYFYDTPEEIEIHEQAVKSRMQKLRTFCPNNQTSTICTQLKTINESRETAFNTIEQKCHDAP
jgi:hypothetical protein